MKPLFVITLLSASRSFPNKGTQSPIEFWPSAYAQRIFGYSAGAASGHHGAEFGADTAGIRANVNSGRPPPRSLGSKGRFK
jgi:hypothetical protein